MNLSTYELAAVRNINKISRKILRKLEIKEKEMNKLAAEYEALAAEYKACESYITGKYGFYSEQILSGEADQIIAEKEAAENAAQQQASQVGGAYEALEYQEPAPEHEDTHVEEGPEPVWGDEENSNEEIPENDNPFED